MKLTLADNIKPERTIHRLPKRTPTHLGLYAEQEGSLHHYDRSDEIWRTEIRLGAQTRIDPQLPQELRELIHTETKGLIMRHVYGPIYDELIRVINDFYKTGINRGDPAFDRVSEMINTLVEAFRGHC